MNINITHKKIYLFVFKLIKSLSSIPGLDNVETGIQEDLSQDQLRVALAGPV